MVVEIPRLFNLEVEFAKGLKVRLNYSLPARILIGAITKAILAYK